jgi:hypothetical protein
MAQVTPPVSVIVPAHNVAVCLPRCIQSILAQEDVRCEVIVVDDGSTDRTADVAAEFGDRICFIQQQNQGQGAARNAGLGAATGEFIAFLDADDYWLPQFLARTVQFLQGHAEAIAVSTGQLHLHWRRPPVKWPRFLDGDTDHAQARPAILTNFFDWWGEYDHVRTGSAVIRHEIIRQAGLQRADLRISQDLEYWAYLATFGRWGFLPEILHVCDPMPAAKKVGWLKRYEQRRRLCPTVESWQARIVPRLTPAELPGFRKARGRVALCFAQSKMLAGDYAGASGIIGTFGAEMPNCWTSRVMKYGARFGAPGRSLSAMLIRGREQMKSLLISIEGKRIAASTQTKGLI